MGVDVGKDAKETKKGGERGTGEEENGRRHQQGRDSFHFTSSPPLLSLALSEAADVYFTAIQKIGEQALQSSTSQILGKMLAFP